jgi:hypothetical protein
MTTIPKKPAAPGTIDPLYGNAPDVLPGPEDRKALVEDSRRAHRKLAVRLKQSRSELADEIEKKQAEHWASSAAATVGYCAPVLHDIALQPVRAGSAPREVVQERHEEIVNAASTLIRRGVEQRHLVSETSRKVEEPASTVRRALAHAGLIPPPKKRA